jgi:hypothetical protein
VNVPPLPIIVWALNRGFPMFRAQRVRPAVLFRDAHGPERQPIQFLDGGPGGEHDLDAATADVHHRGRAPIEIKVPRDARECQTRLILRRDDLDLNSVPPPHLAAKRPPVHRLAHRTGCHDTQVINLKAADDRLHLADRRERLFHRLLAEPAGLGKSSTEPNHFALFVKHAVRAVVLHFGHDQPDRVGADVEHSQACGYGLGRLRTHRCEQSSLWRFLGYTADVRYFLRSRFRNVIAVRFNTTTMISNSSAVVKTIGRAASTLGDWKPTS